MTSAPQQKRKTTFVERFSGDVWWDDVVGPAVTREGKALKNVEMLKNVEDFIGAEMGQYNKKLFSEFCFSFPHRILMFS